MSEDSIEDQKPTGDKLQYFSEEPEAKSAEKKETSSIRFEYAQNESRSTDLELNIENNTEDSLGSFDWIDHPNPDEIQIAGFNKKKLLEMSNFCKITYGNNDPILFQLGYKTRAAFIEEGYDIIPFYYSNKTLASFVFAKDEEITIAYRGTQYFADIITDICALLTPLEFLPEGGRAHYGFYYSFYDSWDSLDSILKTYVSEKKIKDLKFYLTGHSMGGAIAKIAALFLNKKLDVQDLHVATFADPRVFDLTASESYNKALPNRTIRVTQHRCDPVPAVAPGILGYVHVGEQLRISVISGHTAHKIDGYHYAINSIKESDFQPDNGASIFYYPVRLLILINDIVLGNSQYYAANFIRYFSYQDTPYTCFNAIENTNHMSVTPISTITFNPLNHNTQLRMPMMLEVRKPQSISMIKGNNFQLGDNISIFYSSAKILTLVNSALFNGTGFSIDNPSSRKVEFVIQGSSFSHNNNKIKAIQKPNLVEVNDQQKRDDLFDDVSFDEKGNVHQFKMQQVNHTQNLEEPIKNIVIQNANSSNQSLELKADNSELVSDEEQQAISVFFDKALSQLVKFQELYRKYSKSATKTPTEKRLIDNYREFITKHPDINLGRSNVANLKTICAHGTNAWTVLSALVFTNLQLLPKFAMKVRGIPIGVHENTFVHDFLNTFGDELPFSTSDKFDRIPIERTTLQKERIKGELIASTSEAGYYKANSDINVTYDEDDSNYLNAEVANNLHSFNKQESDKKEDTQQLKIQPSITENLNFAENLNAKLTPHIESSISDIRSSTIDGDSQIKVTVDSKIVNNNQPQKASPTKKAVYTTMTISPLIAVGIYAAIALSAGIVFNPIVAAGIFAGVAVAAIACFSAMKVCEKVNDSSVSSCIASNGGVTPECLKRSGAEIS